MIEHNFGAQPSVKPGPSKGSCSQPCTGNFSCQIGDICSQWSSLCASGIIDSMYFSTEPLDWSLKPLWTALWDKLEDGRVYQVVEGRMMIWAINRKHKSKRPRVYLWERYASFIPPLEWMPTGAGTILGTWNHFLMKNDWYRRFSVQLIMLFDHAWPCNSLEFPLLTASGSNSTDMLQILISILFKLLVSSVTADQDSLCRDVLDELSQLAQSLVSPLPHMEGTSLLS